MNRRLLLWLLLIMWFPAGIQTVKAADRPNTKVKETRSFEEFSEAASRMAASYETMGIKSRESQGSFSSGRLIVKADGNFRPDAYGAAEVVKSPDHTYLMQYDNAGEAEKALARIRKQAGVAYAELDEYVECEAIDEKMAADSISWGVSAMGADKYAKYVAAVTSRKIKVAVVDSGVSRHSRLSKRLVKGYNFISLNTNVSDPIGHGTHVAGTIVDCTPGLKVKIMPVRVMNSRGGGYTSIIGLGIQYAVKHGAKVINLSLGGAHSKYMDERISHAVRKGVTVVAASGNENRNTARSCPAHLKKAIVVGAVDQYNRRAYFSNYGKALDVVAPGVNIISTVPGGYKSDSGTSMAAPHVSAVAAMYKLVYPKKKPAAIEKLVKKNVKDLGSKGWDKYYGRGIPRLAPLAVPVKIALSKKQLTIETGQQTTLKVSFTPSTAYKKTIKWKSSNNTVASVNSKGVVTGKKAGTAVITAKTYNGKKAVCKVTVKKSSGSVQPGSEVSVKTGQQYYSCKIGEPLVVDITLNLKDTIRQNAFQHVLYCGYLDAKRLTWMGIGAYDIDGSTYLKPHWEGSAKVTNLWVSGRQAQLRLSFDTAKMEAGTMLFRASIFPYAGFPSSKSLSDYSFILELQP